MTFPPAVQPSAWREPNLLSPLPVEDSSGEATGRARQRTAVIKHLMNTALGDPQVHRRLRTSPDFQAALAALDPERPDFIEDEHLRKIVQIGCLYMIDTTAALLKFARENNFQLVP